MPILWTDAPIKTTTPIWTLLTVLLLLAETVLIVYGLAVGS